MKALHKYNWRKPLHRFLARPRVTNYLQNIVVWIDRPLLKWTKGRFCISGFIGGWLVVNITTIGRKTGMLRTTPIIAIRDKEKIILIASNFARDHHPSWYLNLKKNPQAYVNELTNIYNTRQAQPDEYEYYWDLAVNTYYGYEVYRQRTHRSIPILVLEPTKLTNEFTQPELPG